MSGPSGCLEPCFIYTAVKNQEARVAHMESVLTSIVKQVRGIPEEMMKWYGAI